MSEKGSICLSRRMMYLINMLIDFNPRIASLVMSAIQEIDKIGVSKLSVDDVQKHLSKKESIDDAINTIENYGFASVGKDGTNVVFKFGDEFVRRG